MASTDASPRAPAEENAGNATPSQRVKVQQPRPQVLAPRSGPSAILVSTRQKGNPILNHIKLLPWEYADIVADYVVGAAACALFLSLRYHRLHPEYIYGRIRQLGAKFNLRILLVMVDISNHEECLKELSKTSIVNNLTLILCWSAPEAAHYLELFKSSEHAQPTAIRSQQAQSYKESLVEFVTMPRSINKSDAASLISTFGSLQNAINALPEQVGSVPGWGEKKVQQWTNAVRKDFRVEAAKKRTAPPPRTANDDRQSNRMLLDSQGLPSVLGNSEHDDEQEAMPLSGSPAKDGHSAQALAVDQEPASRPGAPGDESEISEGIMAALAKLRNQSG